MSAPNQNPADNNPPSYTTSFQQLMAQRYPQPGANPVNNPLANQSSAGQYFQGQQTTQRTEFAPPSTTVGMGSTPQVVINANTALPSGIPSVGGTATNVASSTSTTAATVQANAKAALQKLSSSMAPNNSKTASKSGKRSSATSRGSGSAASSGINFNTPQQNQWLAQCDYRDKTLWATRLLLGGNSVNGFLRSTATVQRIKKQRARQNASTKQSRAVAAAKAAAIGNDQDPNAAAAVAAASVGKTSKGSAAAFDPVEEEKLKKEIMNPRTAKKLKSEFEQGLLFCATVCNVLRGVLFDMDKSLASSLPPALIIEQPKPPPKFTFLVPSDPEAAARLAAEQNKQTLPQPVQAAAGSGMDPSARARASFKAKTSAIPGSDKISTVVQPSTQSTEQPEQPNASPGGVQTSTLRKLRKKKFALTAPAVNLPEVDANGKRLCTKKEHQYRVFQILRYRELRQGDFCAARLSSRDLWILAKVLRDYKISATSPPHNLQPVEFLQLTDAKRDAIFREKVVLQDVEEGEDAGSTLVARNLVLPLPRDFAEASEWTTRLKKGSRVYAMYPQTTSLYPATVVDSTTYCRGDDDIVVVEFDGEEIDPMTGKVPSYHIPARFVTLIPREFPASQPPKTGGSQTGKRKSTASVGGGNKKRSSTAMSEPDEFELLAGMDFDAGAGLGFDELDLDFDKPLDGNSDKQQDQFPPF